MGLSFHNILKLFGLALSIHWYFALRTKHREQIKKWITILQKNGHDISFDWALLGSLTPYEQHQQLSHNRSQQH